MDACEATPSILRCSSYSKPSMTDVTTMSTATARPMPIIETSEMNEIKLSPRRARRSRAVIASSYGCLIAGTRSGRERSFVAQRFRRSDGRRPACGIQRREHGQRERDERDRDRVRDMHLGRHLGHVVDVACADAEPERLLEPRHEIGRAHV